MRRAGYNQQWRDPNTDKFVRLLPEAFKLRPIDKGALSVTWLEYFGLDYDANVIASITKISKCMPSSQKDAVFAVAQVCAIKAAAKARGSSVRVVYHPSDCNPAHAVILQLNDSDVALLDELAKNVFAHDIRWRNGKSAA